MHECGRSLCEMEGARVRTPTIVHASGMLSGSESAREKARGRERDGETDTWMGLRESSRGRAGEVGTRTHLVRRRSGFGWLVSPYSTDSTSTAQVRSTVVRNRRRPGGSGCAAITMRSVTIYTRMYTVTNGVAARRCAQRALNDVRPKARGFCCQGSRLRSACIPTGIVI